MLLLSRFPLLALVVAGSMLAASGAAAAATVVVSPPDLEGGERPIKLPKCWAGYGVVWPHVDWDCCVDLPPPFTPADPSGLGGVTVVVCRGHAQVCVECISQDIILP